MTKIIKSFIALFLALTSVIGTPAIRVDKIEAQEDRITDTTTYYNDFQEVMGDWITYQGELRKQLNDGKLKLENIGDSIILNDNDAIRSSGDLEIKFNYQGTRCFGFVFRADKNTPGKYQSVVLQTDETYSSAKWSIGQPGGKWNTYENAPLLEVGKDYTLIMRYHDTNVTIVLNGEEVFNEEIVYDNDEYIDGDWVGISGIRQLCGNNTFEIDSFVSAPYNTIQNTGFPIINKDMYLSDFENDQSSYLNLKGGFNKQVNGDEMTITNTEQESIMLNKKDKTRNIGDIEMDFTYQEGARCFGPVFRADENNSNQWQTVAYQVSEKNETVWSVGHPGGYWNSYPATKLIDGVKYKLVIRYSGSNIQIYLNGKEELNEEIIHATNGPIKDDWVGQMGFRKYCSIQPITIERFISADYGAIPDEGLSDILYMQGKDIPQEPEKPEKPSEPEENLMFYQKMRELWRNQKVGNFSVEDLEDEYISNHINNLNDDANHYITTITNGGTGVWDKKPSDTISANITTQFKKLNTITRAYATPNTDIYQSEEILELILKSLEHLTSENWFDGVKVTGNWWDFQVGIPQELIDILIILYDDMPSELVLKYANIVAQYIPNAERQINGAAQGSYVPISFGVKTSGANRTDLALTYLATGMLLEKQEIMQDIIPSINSVFKIVTRGDGFYIDGSFIQHGDIPYTGSYGNIAVKGVGKILSLLEGTPWQMEADKIEEFSKLVYDSFVPLVYKGETSPMVGGRSISRAPNARKEGFGSATIYNLLIVSNFASEPYKTQLKEAAKYWILQDSTNYYFNNNRDLRDILEVKAVLDDPNIKGTEVPFKGSRIFGSMDRFVHASENYNLGISMHSSRISAFEAGNKENKKGWFTSDGMMYIQNEDKQFGEDYWPTVDFYRLPGTTVDTRPLEETIGSFSRQRSPQAYVGGSTDGRNSAVAMVLNKDGFKNNGKVIGYDLKAFKSWHINDDVIYALGAGINGHSPSSIETIVENRIMDDAMNYKLISNLNFTNNSVLSVSKGDWFMLQADDSKNNIAYVFLDDHDIKLVNESRTGRYSDINEAFVNGKTYNETYQKIIIDHGQEAKDAKYAYAVLPGVTKAEVESFLKSDYQILSNTSDIQAVKVNGTTMVNIFPVSGGTVEDLKVNGAVSYVMNENETSIVLNVSDPRQKDSVFDFELDRDRVALSEKSVKSRSLKFSVDTKNKAGASTEVKLIKYADIRELEIAKEKFNKIDIDTLTLYSKSLYQKLEIEMNQVIANPQSTQSEVDSVTFKLNEFLSSYDNKIDFDFADITIEYINELVQSDYTEDSWQAMSKKLKEVEEMLDSYDENEVLLFKQEDLDARLSELQDLINNLEVNIPPLEVEVDTTILNELLDLFETINSKEFTVDSYKSLFDRVKEVKKYLEIGQLTQEKVDGYSEELFDLYDKLEKVKDIEPEEEQDLEEERYLELRKLLVSQIKDRYKNGLITYEKKLMIKDKIENATKISEFEKIAQEYKLDLSLKPEEPENKEPEFLELESLENLIEEALSHLTGEYTKESLMNLEKQVTIAQEVLKRAKEQNNLNKIITAELINETEINLKKAISDLVPLEITIPNKPGTNKPGTNKPGTNKPGTNKPVINEDDTNKFDSEKPNTAVVQSYTSYAFVIACGIFILYVVKRKRKKIKAS